MEKLKVGDRARIIETPYCGGLDVGNIVTIAIINEPFCNVLVEGDTFLYFFKLKQLIKLGLIPKSRSKQISQSLKHICTKGLVIKSENIIAKVKESIGTEYVFGDTILRALRHLRQDGILDYTADKNTREYTFR